MKKDKKKIEYAWYDPEFNAILIGQLCDEVKCFIKVFLPHAVLLGRL